MRREGACIKDSVTNIKYDIKQNWKMDHNYVPLLKKKL